MGQLFKKENENMKNIPPQDYDNIKELYKSRFNSEDIENKKKTWRIITQNFFQKFISPDDVVVDIGAGYCEFINNIKCKEKIAVDLGPINNFANPEVKTIITSCTNLTAIPSQSVNVVFVSNLFEHLLVNEIDACMKEIYRILIPNGKLLILQPNIRYAYKEYWDFFDHVTPLSHNSTEECLHKHGFQIELLKKKFLPYSTKSKIPKWTYLIKMYLRSSLLQQIFGKQLFVIGRKI